MPKEEKLKKEEEIKKETEEEALENRCPACRASIKFNPTLGVWKCEYCGGQFTLEELQHYNDNASKEEKHSKKDDYDEYISYKCESCGAEIIADKDTSATFCIYCGNTAILKSKLSGKFLPDKIIPFKTEKEQAIEAFKSLSRHRPFVPRDFTRESNIEKIRGVYIPFWLYDIKVTGDITMDCKVIDTWRRGDTHYTKTSTFLAKRGGEIKFSLVPVDGSTKFDNAVMNTIEPFKYDELIDYNHAYLSGFYAEKYDTEGEEIFNEASGRAINTAREFLREDTSKRYTTKIITSDSLKSNQEKREYALLPVWMVNVRYKGENHIFAMNGQTGEFIGNIPLDKTKVVIYSILIFTIIMALIIGFCYLLNNY